MIKVDDKRGSFIEVIFWAGIWLVLLHMITGCSEHSRRIYIGMDVYEAGNESKSMKAKETKPGN